jgi:5-methyltetrahydrofolate--homocysteine methyltransferase
MAVQDVYDAVIGMNQGTIVGLVQKELDTGTDVQKILDDGLIAALDEVGQKFSRGDFFLPEMLRAANVMKKGLEIIKPLLTETQAASAGTVVIGAVKGDLHDIGKDLVGMMLEGAGFKVIDLGTDVAPEVFVRAAKENEAGVVGLSALLTTTMPAMRKTVAMLRTELGNIKTMIGGAPVTQAFCEDIGADGYGEDAPTAVTLARKFIAGK